MNIYFLVEGRRTEKKVYPRWLLYLVPELEEVKFAFEVNNNNFYTFSGNGFPSLLDNHLRNSIDDVNDIGRFDYLVICLDSDGDTVEQRKFEVAKFINDNNLKLNTSELIIIVQNKCIETWFLGNTKAYTRQPQSIELRKFIKFYNVQENDPEEMTKMEDFSTDAQFHEAYLSEMLSEKNIRYTKKNPTIVTEKHYLDELMKRTRTTHHINTFKELDRK